MRPLRCYSIGSGAFEGLTSLTSIQIPAKRYLYRQERSLVSNWFDTEIPTSA
jgi:hypothetical protein